MGGATLEAALLDERLPTPLYHQIYLLLRERIVSGVLLPDTLLQGEQEMAKQLGVSRITVKRAMNELAADGLVARYRGRGTLVVGGAITPLVAGSFHTLMDGLQKMGIETQVELLEVGEVLAGEAVAARLEIEADAKVQRVVRLRRLRSEPFSYLVTHVPIEIASRYAKEDLASSTFLALMERAGVKAQEAEQWISATAASPVIAASLAVPSGSPLLKIERVMRGPLRQPVQMIEACYRPDRFQYHVRSRRRAGDGASWSHEG